MENSESKKKQAWETFTRSGKVEDYLAYNSLNKGEAYDNDKNKGNSGGGNNLWGT